MVVVVVVVEVRFWVQTVFAAPSVPNPLGNKVSSLTAQALTNESIA